MIYTWKIASPNVLNSTQINATWFFLAWYTVSSLFFIGQCTINHTGWLKKTVGSTLENYFWNEYYIKHNIYFHDNFISSKPVEQNQIYVEFEGVNFDDRTDFVVILTNSSAQWTLPDPISSHIHIKYKSQHFVFVHVSMAYIMT